MNSNARTILLAVVITCLVSVLLTATCVYSGMYNVSAAGRQQGIAAAALRTIADRSIRSHATAVVPPLVDSLAIESAALRFHTECVVCHGAPGVPRGEIGEGLNPAAPELSARAARVRSEPELFWIIRNGIRFSGMPSFQQSHSDDQIWAIARFVKQMDGMTELRYEAIFRAIMLKNGGVLPGVPAGAAHEHAMPPAP
ncbi:MAG: cytochrome c [Longimicrobiales bacterium]